MPPGAEFVLNVEHDKLRAASSHALLLLRPPRFSSRVARGRTVTIRGARSDGALLGSAKRNPDLRNGDIAVARFGEEVAVQRSSERCSVAITSHLAFSKWDQIFQEAMSTAVAIDRVAHHYGSQELNVGSYRAQGDYQRTRSARAGKGAKMRTRRCAPRRYRRPRWLRMLPHYDVLQSLPDGKMRAFRLSEARAGAIGNALVPGHQGAARESEPNRPRGNDCHPPETPARERRWPQRCSLRGKLVTRQDSFRT